MGSCQDKDRKKYNDAQDYIMKKSLRKSVQNNKKTEQELLKDRIQAMFDEFDKNKDGKLSEDELQRFLKAVYSKQVNNKKQYHEISKQLMELIDRNDNRQIDKEEFYQFYRS